VYSAARDRLANRKERDERRLFQLGRELLEQSPRYRVDLVLADVTHAAMTRRTCERTLPHVVFHAAEYTHVAMAERAVCAAIQTLSHEIV